MKNILYLFLIIIFNQSCNSFDNIISDLDESEIDLEFGFYIQEGWTSFQSGDFDNSSTFFDYIIDAFENSTQENPSVISSNLLFEAYHGLAWSQVFSANSSQNLLQKSILRENSYLNFFRADSILDEITSVATNYPFDYDCDIIAGKILYHDYKIYSSYNEYFSFDGDSQYLDDVEIFRQGESFQDLNFNGSYDVGEQFSDYNQNGYFESGLNFLVNKLITECSEYNFPFENLDIYNFKMMLIKDYLRGGKYDEIADFISDIELTEINLEFKLSSETLLNDELYLIGDFQNKIIDDKDLYPLDSDGKVTVTVTPFLPCNISNLSSSSESYNENLRNELLDCIDTYFETSTQLNFRYKFVNGSYDGNLNNQENNLSSTCSDSEGFRFLTINLENDINLPLYNHCFNSCSESCYSY